MDEFKTSEYCDQRGQIMRPVSRTIQRFGKSESPEFLNLSLKADFFSEKWLLVGSRGRVNDLGRRLEKRFLVLY